MRVIHLIAPPACHTDEELLLRLAAGRDDALEPLHQRYAGRVFAFVARRLDPETADEITQDVFLALWRNALRFDPARGPARPWILQIAHLRILHELRTRQRRPQIAPDPDQHRLNATRDAAPQPDEAAWRRFQRRAIADALATLPPGQREAVRLALFEDLTHEQVAATTHAPLGAAKTRIRDGMRRLRVALLPVVAGVALALAVGRPAPAPPPSPRSASAAVSTMTTATGSVPIPS